MRNEVEEWYWNCICMEMLLGLGRKKSNFTAMHVRDESYGCLSYSTCAIPKNKLNKMSRSENIFKTLSVFSKFHLKIVLEMPFSFSPHSQTQMHPEYPEETTRQWDEQRVPDSPSFILLLNAACYLSSGFRFSVCPTHNARNPFRLHSQHPKQTRFVVWANTLWMLCLFVRLQWNEIRCA